ncbi:MAG: mechanosensitive ion channel [Phormidesmis sp.]
MGISFFRRGSLPTLAQASTDRSFSLNTVTESFGVGFGEFLPNLLGAIAILVIGVLIAYVVAFAVKSLLKKTNIDDRIAASVTKRPASDVPVEKWISDFVFWIIVLFVVIAALEALQLTAVSEPLNGLLATILEYLPRIVMAGVLLALAWGIATVVKAIVTRGLESFNLDDRLAENTGVDPRQNAVQIHETLGNALYWFVFLLFLPLVLNALQLNGLLEPVQSLIDQFLAAIPKILLAALIAIGGWLLAKIVRGIVTNLLAASGVDNIGRRLGLSSSSATGSGVSISGLAGTIVYVAILIPVAIAALEELDIQAVSVPAISMLNQILDFLPLLLAAGVVLTVFYFIGKFVSELVTNLLASAGFDSVLDILGLPDVAPSTTTTRTTPTPTAYQPSDIGSTAVQPGSTVIQPSSSQPSGLSDPATSASSGKSPSEVVGLVVLVGIVLFGLVTATEILQLEQLTLIVSAVMAIAAQVLVGVVILAIGIYVANLAFRLIKSSNSAASNTLAQAARVAILAFVGALALGQMGVATNIVNLAFGLLLGAVAVAIAIAFGLGGRDVAAEELRSWINHVKR